MYFSFSVHFCNQTETSNILNSSRITPHKIDGRIILRKKLIAVNAVITRHKEHMQLKCLLLANLYCGYAHHLFYQKEKFYAWYYSFRKLSLSCNGSLPFQYVKLLPSNWYFSEIAKTFFVSIFILTFVIMFRSNRTCKHVPS